MFSSFSTFLSNSSNMKLSKMILSFLSSSVILTANTTTISGFSGTQSSQNGDYAAMSSGNIGGWEAYKCFNNNDRDGFHGPDNPYTGPDNSYVGSKNVVIDGITTYCEWITIKFPFNFVLTNCSIGGRGGGSYITRIPKDYTLSGSDDGINWKLLNNQVGVTTFDNTFNVLNNISYSYYVLSVTKCASSDVLNIGTIRLNGNYVVIL